MLKRLWASRVGAAVLLLCIYLLIFGFTKSIEVERSAIAVSTQASHSSPTIILDAGHGGIDSGCVSINGVEEKDINLSIILKLRDMLEVSGYEVVMTRDSDRSIHDAGIQGLGKQKLSDMKNRLAIINSYDNGIFISVHQNQFTDSRYSGAQMFYPESDGRSEQLASILQSKFVEYLQPSNERETKPIGDEIYLLYNASCPRVMAECGFLSNPEEAELLEDEEYQAKVAFVLYSGICEYISEHEQ